MPDQDQTIVALPGTPAMDAVRAALVADGGPDAASAVPHGPATALAAARRVAVLVDPAALGGPAEASLGRRATQVRSAVEGACLDADAVVVVFGPTPGSPAAFRRLTAACRSAHGAILDRDRTPAVIAAALLAACPVATFTVTGAWADPGGRVRSIADALGGRGRTDPDAPTSAG